MRHPGRRVWSKGPGPPGAEGLQQEKNQDPPVGLAPLAGVLLGPDWVLFGSCCCQRNMHLPVLPWQRSSRVPPAFRKQKRDTGLKIDASFLLSFVLPVTTDLQS